MMKSRARYVGNPRLEPAGGGYFDPDNEAPGSAASSWPQGAA